MSVLRIPREAIDDRAARGLRDGDESNERARGLTVLFECKPLLVLAAALALFHLGNGAMLPLYGLAVVAAKQGNPATFVAATIVVAQATMILAALVAMRMSEKRGLWLILLISFAALPLRGLIAAYFIKSWGVFPVQISGWSRRRPAERRGPGPGGAHLEWNRSDQRRSGCRHDSTRRRRFAESRDRRLACAVAGVRPGVPDSRGICVRLAPHLDRIRRDRQTGLYHSERRRVSHALTANVATWSIAAVSVLGVITRPRNLPEALWAVLGAVALVVFSLLSAVDALAAILKGTDVYLFLIGMMVLAELARREGLFDWLAAYAVNHAAGSANQTVCVWCTASARSSRSFCPTMPPRWS